MMKLDAVTASLREWDVRHTSAITSPIGESVTEPSSLMRERILLRSSVQIVIKKNFLPRLWRFNFMGVL